MKKNDETQRHIVQELSQRIGKKLAAQVGKGRLLDIAATIADYEEQAGWQNTVHETRRLVDKIRYLPAEFGINTGALRLSKKSAVDLNAALWKTLRSRFPSLEIKPNELIPS